MWSPYFEKGEMNGKLPDSAGFIYRICCRIIIVPGNKTPE